MFFRVLLCLMVMGFSLGYSENSLPNFVIAKLDMATATASHYLLADPAQVELGFGKSEPMLWDVAFDYLFVPDSLTKSNLPRPFRPCLGFGIRM